MSVYTLQLLKTIDNQNLIIAIPHSFRSSDTQGLVAEVSIAPNDGIRGVIEWTHIM